MPSAQRSICNSALNVVVALAICCGSVVSFVPLSPVFPAATLDRGWAFGMNVATAQGLVGQKVVFTFGPYASLYTSQYFPQTDMLMLGGGAFLAVASIFALLCLAVGGKPVAAVGFALFLPIVAGDAQLLSPALLTLLQAYRISLPRGQGIITQPRDMIWRAEVVALLLLTAALALLALVKGTFAIAGVMTMGLVMIMLVSQGQVKIAAGCVALFAVAVPTFWQLADQPMAHLPNYFVHQLPIISGYSDAMSLPGPAWQVVLFVVCCMLLWRLHLRHFASNANGKCLLVGIALVLFLGFKEGFVRHDGHAVTAAGIAAMGGWAAMQLGRSGVARIASLAVMLLCWLLIINAYASLADFVADPYIRAKQGITARLCQPGYPASGYTDALSEIRRVTPLPTLRGPTDIYSFGQSALLAAGLDWDPRPVLQSYSAYTPSLARQDAAHLLGAAAPANIIFSVQPIDGRLPSLEDGASWPLLLSRYRLAGYIHLPAYQEDAAILEHRASPARFVLQPISEGRFSMREAIPLPVAPNTALWAEIRIKPTLVGRFISVVFKLPPLIISYRFSNGVVQNYRYIEGMGESGFVISPLVGTAAEFIALAQAPSSLSFPVVVSIRPATRPWLWQHRFHIRLSALKFPPG